MNKSILLLVLITIMSVLFTGCFNSNTEDTLVEENNENMNSGDEGDNVVSTDTDESRGIDEEDVIIEEVTINSDEELDFGELI